MWFRLRWPREVAPEQVTQMFRLLASAGGGPIIVEAIGSPGAVEHRFGLAERAGREHGRSAPGCPARFECRGAT